MTSKVRILEFILFVLVMFCIPYKTYAAECTAYERIHPTYPLSGAHLSTGKCTSCGLCHINAVWNGTPRTCIACHNGDPSRMTVGRSPRHLPTMLIDCGGCHNTMAFNSTSGITQSMIHAQVTSMRCDSCHNGMYTAYGAQGKGNNHPRTARVNGVTVLVTSVDCNYCHSSNRPSFD